MTKPDRHAGGPSGRRTLPFDLMVISDPSIDGWLDALVAVIASAPPQRVAIQVRQVGAGAAELRWLAANVGALARPRGVPWLVNDRADVAALTEATGVHLKESGLEVADARALLGPSAWLGASCHDAAGLARREDADYAVLGPFAEVPGKGPALGPTRFAELARNTPLPVLALGGIDARAAGAAIEAGAAGVAVVRAVLAARDPVAAMHALLDAMDAARRAQA